MADVKITALTAISANPVNPATFPMPMVDLLDTSMAASGTTKKVTVNQILGAGGTATLASATITGDLTVDTNVLKVDTTNDRVGIGTASPTAALDVYRAEVSAAAGTSAIITNTTGGGNRIAALRLNNLSNNWHIRAVGAVTDDLRIGAGVIGSEVDYLAIGNTGNVNVALGNVVMATSGKGIDFSATANSSGTMTSELLNDYEEGTFTANLIGSTTNPTSPVATTAKYTKIGRVVNVVIYYQNVTTTGASGAVQVTGLPFTSSAGSFNAGSAVSGDTATFTGTLGAWLAPSSTQVDLLASASGGSITGAVHSAGANRYLALNITYTV